MFWYNKDFWKVEIVFLIYSRRTLVNHALVHIPGAKSPVTSYLRRGISLSWNGIEYALVIWSIDVKAWRTLPHMMNQHVNYDEPSKWPLLLTWFNFNLSMDK